MDILFLLESSALASGPVGMGDTVRIRREGTGATPCRRCQFRDLGNPNV